MAQTATKSPLCCGRDDESDGDDEELPTNLSVRDTEWGTKR
ncbi:hypothetical protein ZOD2009_08464 [Haladaptatus paucihalophilus DX253]|uniref:Uncharacterized protein n=1 Tax=Haladaptatus paucihalophilus DX253 TaxID=797209 RepID=E7QSC0_HALPU|nr:hypothetical protein ZOD2009_08464 [Haladaptatus paucihalophilus DX253]